MVIKYWYVNFNPSWFVISNLNPQIVFHIFPIITNKYLFFKKKSCIHVINQHEINFEPYDHLQIVLAIVFVYLEVFNVLHIDILSIFLCIDNGCLACNFFPLVHLAHICIRHIFATRNSGYPLYNFDGLCWLRNCILSIFLHTSNGYLGYNSYCLMWLHKNIMSIFVNTSNACLLYIVHIDKHCNFLLLFQLILEQNLEYWEQY